jgi:hypothetical protein
MSTRTLSPHRSSHSLQTGHDGNFLVRLAETLFPIPPPKETRSAPLTTSSPLPEDLAKEFGHNAISTQKYTW